MIEKSVKCIRMYTYIYAESNNDNRNQKWIEKEAKSFHSVLDDREGKKEQDKEKVEQTAIMLAEGERKQDIFRTTLLFVSNNFCTLHANLCAYQIYET